LFAVVVSIVAGWALATSLADPVARPEGLTRVLRGMVLIKGGMLAGAVALAFRRLGRILARRPAVGYTVGMAVTGFAAGVLWSLSFIGLGSGLFYLGFLVALWAVSHDQAMLRGWKASENSEERASNALEVQGEGRSAQPDQQGVHAPPNSVPARIAPVPTGGD